MVPQRNKTGVWEDAACRLRAAALVVAAAPSSAAAGPHARLLRWLPPAPASLPGKHPPCTLHYEETTGMVVWRQAIHCA